MIKTIDWLELNQLLPELARRVQKEYDEWNQEADPETGDSELGFGGICQNFAYIIAEAVGELTGFDTAIMSAQIGEQHVWAIVRTPEGIYEIDIPACVYETGGGYNWKKIPDITFTEQDFVINLIDSDPNVWEEFLDD